MPISITIIVASAILATVGTLLIQEFLKNKKEDKVEKRIDIIEYDKQLTVCLSNLSENIPDFNFSKFDKTNSQARKWMVELFKLYGRQYGLNKKKIVTDGQWLMWREGMFYQLKQKVFKEGFEFCSSQIHMDKDFKTFINTFILNNVYSEIDTHKNKVVEIVSNQKTS